MSYTRRVIGAQEFRQCRLFTLRPPDTGFYPVWSGPGVLHYILITNVTGAAATFSLYDTDEGQTPDDDSLLAHELDAPPNTMVPLEFPFRGLGIPVLQERTIWVQPSVAGALVFHGYGVPE